jgi:WbqC-like protein family
MRPVCIRCRNPLLVAMSKKVAIVQSNYIPWRGYFDLINSVDEFILYDDMQYTIRDWRNRNLIKTANGPLWLTIPVEVKGKYFQKIKDTVVSDPAWGRKHWASITHSYAKARHFAAYKEMFAELYAPSDERFLSRINHRFIVAICRLLGIETTISWSMDYELMGDKTEKLVGLCKQAGATHYISGPAARSYMVEELFTREEISVSYMDYSGYREYSQLYPPFEPQVSILDLIFNEGLDAKNYMKSF